MSNPIIYVLGVPSGGTSVVAGILHHLGVNMGNIYPGIDRRGYRTFECRSAKTFLPAQRNIVAEILAGEGGSRDFRSYLEWRIKDAGGDTPQGVKLGAAYWVGEPDPWTLPVRILRIHRPLEDSIESDARYQVQLRDDFTPEASVFRSAQMGGYYQAANVLCGMIPPTLELDFEGVLVDPMDAIIHICHAFNLEPDEDQRQAATRFVDPEMRNV